jgi:hypothetical protein
MAFENTATGPTIKNSLVRETVKVEAKSDKDAVEHAKELYPGYNLYLVKEIEFAYDEE